MNTVTIDSEKIEYKSPLTKFLDLSELEDVTQLIEEETLHQCVSDSEDIISLPEIASEDIDDICEVVCEFLIEDIESRDYLDFSDPGFDKSLYNNAKMILYEQYGYLDDWGICNLDEFSETICLYATEMFKIVVNTRSYVDSVIRYELSPQSKERINKTLMNLDERSKNLPPQRTEEWYKHRHNLLSASSIWKALDSQSNQNNIIYEKCKPYQMKNNDYVSINSPLHHGQKYEPVSQMYYEYVYNTKIKEYGCIPHEMHKFLGASPDGINADPNSNRYGRMLEIKNIVNREINGIPKKEYWIQMQLQMECCNLFETDFLECRFKEYPDYNEFIKDGNTFNKTESGKYKGVMLQFHINGKPHYEYMPWGITEQECDAWEESMKTKLGEDKWVHTIYWYLEHVSCVLVPRNELWFKGALPKFEKIWKTIERERVEGYEHRAPKSRKGAKKSVMETKVKKVDNTTENDKQTTLNFVKKPKPKKERTGLIIKIDI